MPPGRESPRSGTGQHPISRHELDRVETGNERVQPASGEAILPLLANVGGELADERAHRGRCGRCPDGCEPTPDHRTKIVRNVF
jgi:hypothetical protein